MVKKIVKFICYIIIISYIFIYKCNIENILCYIKSIKRKKFLSCWYNVNMLFYSVIGFDQSYDLIFRKGNLCINLVRFKYWDLMIRGCLLIKVKERLILDVNFVNINNLQ